METIRTLKSITATSSNTRTTEGKIGWALLWLMGVPLPVLFIVFLMRGCT